jgi:hypothetical protein
VGWDWFHLVHRPLLGRWVCTNRRNENYQRISECVEDTCSSVTLLTTNPTFFIFFSVLYRVIHCIWIVGHSLIFYASLKYSYMDDDECGAVGGMIGNGDWITRRKHAPVPLCPHKSQTELAAVGSQLLPWLSHGQMPHYLTWDQTKTSAVGSRPLTTWAMHNQVQP